MKKKEKIPSRAWKGGHSDLKPIDSASFRMMSVRKDKDIVPRGTTVCGLCGKEFKPGEDKSLHQKTEHPHLYPSFSDKPLNVQCQLCGDIIENTPDTRKEHLDLHGSQTVLENCPEGLFKKLE